MFTCPAARFLWNFTREALGPTWLAHDLGEFLETQAHQPGKGRRLFWLVFAAMSWSLWNIRNKMVIEKILPRRASDSIFRFLAYLQLWYPLCRQQDKTRLDATLRQLLEAARRLPPSPARLPFYVLSVVLGRYVLWPQHLMCI